MDPLRYVRTGEKPRASASMTNALIDSARKAKMGGLGFKEPTHEQQATQIFIRAHESLDRFSPVMIDTHATTISDVSQFQKTPVFDSSGPVADQPFVIVTEKVGYGNIGRAIAFGPATAVVKVSDATHRYARIDSTGTLVSANYGQAKIIWAQPEPEPSETHIAGDPWDAWCLIAVGDSVKPDGLPYGYIRLYRGALTGTWTAGDWLYNGLTVQDETTLEPLGSEGSATKTNSTGIDFVWTVVLLQDLPDPYSSAVPEGMPNKDRQDYCIASIGGAVKISLDANLIVPSSETAGTGGSHGFVETDPQELSDMASEETPSTLQTFQTNNVWQYLGAGYYSKLNKQVVNGAGAGLVFDGTRFKLNAALPGVVGANPFAFCCTSIVDGVPSFGFVEITPGTGGGGMEEFIAGPSLEFVDGEPQTLQLVADANDAVGFYHADVNESAPTREWVKNDGSLVVEDATVGKTLHLQGDKEAPTSGTDKLLYVYDRSPTEDANKKRKWAKLGANGGLEISDTTGSEGVRLAGTTGTAPAVGAVWGRISSTEYGWFTPIVIVIS